MTHEELTYSQRELLQRWHDGELAGEQAGRAEELVDSSEAARSYVERLEELGDFTRAAVDEARPAPSERPDAASIVEAATSAPPMADEPLAELAPLLERYHDGEVTGAERAAVEILRAERDDVDDYLGRLDWLGDTVRAADRQMSESADLGEMWEGVAARLDAGEADAPPEFEPARHAELIHRYADGEVDADERRWVEGWLEDPSGEAAQLYEAIGQLGEATRIASDEAKAGVEMDALWEGVSERLDQAEGDNIVRLDEARDETKASETSTVDESAATESGLVLGWFGDYSQGIISAAAAAAILIVVGALFGPRIFQNERVVVKEKTVVIVDSVEYGSGSSVVVDSPMKKVSSKPDDKEPNDKTEQEEKPTVIWLLDNGSGSSEGADEETDPAADEESAPAQPEPDAAQPPAEPDAGETPRKRGQPI